MQPTRKRRPSSRREARSTLGLVAFGGLMASCVEGGLSVELPLEGAVAAFVIRHDERQVLSVQRLEEEGDGISGLASAREEELISILELGRELLLASYPAVDQTRLETVSIQSGVTDAVCAQRFERDGKSIEIPLPESAPTWRWMPGEASALQRLPLPAPVVAELRLSLPLGSCALPFLSRPFAMDRQLLPNPFLFEGRWRNAESSAIEDVDVFTVTDAAYVDPDTAVVLLGHGLVLLRRGERLESTDDPEYFPRQSFPSFGSVELWHLRSVAVRPAEQGRPLRVFVAGFRRSQRPRQFDTLGALLSLEDGRPEVLSATVTLGKAGRAGVDVTGRFFVPLSGAPVEAHDQILLVDPESTTGPFEIVDHEDEVKQISPTYSEEDPHAILARGGDRLQVGDIRQARFPIDEDLPFAGDVPGNSGHSLTTWTEGTETRFVVGGEQGEFVVRREGGRWESFIRHFDAPFRASRCVSAPDQCGNVRSPPELAELSVLRGDDGSSWVMSAPDDCPHALATRGDGCTSVIDFDHELTIDQSRFLTAIRPNRDETTALVGGRGGFLIELAP